MRGAPETCPLRFPSLDTQRAMATRHYAGGVRQRWNVMWSRAQTIALRETISLRKDDDPAGRGHRQLNLPDNSRHRVGVPGT
jgi:hypothetical protein